MSDKISNKPYDDTFKSALVHCRQVVVPLVNEAFGTSYGFHEEIKFRNTELYNLQGNTERDVDTMFSIGDSKKLYHLECESSTKNVVVRMFEYDTMVALQNHEIVNGRLRTKFPVSAVMYLRSSETIPDKYDITMEVGDKEFSYTIPVLKVSDYSLDDIFAKKLYFLLPFHFFVYEKDLKDYNSGKKDISQLMADFDYWLERLIAVDEQEISSSIKGCLQQYAYNVALALTGKYKVVNKEVEKYMGGRVMQYSPVEELINKAKNEMKKQNDAEMAKKDAEIAEKDAEHKAIHEKDQATIASLRAEIARMKAEKSA